MPEIARQRGLKPGAILNHIEKGLRRLSDISYLKEALPQSDFGVIMGELQKSDDGKPSPVHQKPGGRYAYEDLQLVRLFIDGTDG